MADIMTSGSDSEGIFKPSPNIGGYTLNSKAARGHSFAAKTVIKPEICSPCGKRYSSSGENFKPSLFYHFRFHHLFIFTE